MSEVISSFSSFRAGSQVFALRMLFLCVILHTQGSHSHGKSWKVMEKKAVMESHGKVMETEENK